MKSSARRPRAGKPVSAGQVVPIKLPKDPHDAGPLVRILNETNNRNKLLLDLLAAYARKDKIKKPGDTVFIEIPEDISPEALFWFNAHIGETGDGLFSWIESMLQGNVPVQKMLSIPGTATSASMENQGVASHFESDRKPQLPGKNESPSPGLADPETPKKKGRNRNEAM